MSTPTPVVRGPYKRSMQGWWKRDPFFTAYMVRETTALAVLVYAVILAVGVMRLAQGEAPWNAWLAALTSPLSIVLHAVLLFGMAVHAKSWFVIMPKTMPMIFVGGKRLAADTITHAGWWATVVASLALLALAFWGQS
jgi:fumarate reductase subunit C